MKQLIEDIYMGMIPTLLLASVLIMVAVIFPRMPAIVNFIKFLWHARTLSGHFSY